VSKHLHLDPLRELPIKAWVVRTNLVVKVNVPSVASEGGKTVLKEALALDQMMVTVLREVLDQDQMMVTVHEEGLDQVQTMVTDPREGLVVVINLEEALEAMMASREVVDVLVVIAVIEEEDLEVTDKEDVLVVVMIAEHPLGVERGEEGDLVMTKTRLVDSLEETTAGKEALVRTIDHLGDLETGVEALEGAQDLALLQLLQVLQQLKTTGAVTALALQPHPRPLSSRQLSQLKQVPLSVTKAWTKTSCWLATRLRQRLYMLRVLLNSGSS